MSAADGGGRRSAADGGGSSASVDDERPATASPASRGRRRAILVVLTLALAALVSGVPTWVRSAGTTALAGEVPVTVSGTQAAPGVPAAALVLLSAGIAVGLAGRLGRWVVVAAVLAAGLLQLASALSVTADPEPVARRMVAGATGVDALAAPAELTGWPWMAAVVGVLVVAAGVWLAATSGLWARPSDRHDVARARPAGVAPDVVPDDDRSAWDALTRGHDPT